jgi:hypothetical protein
MTSQPSLSSVNFWTSKGIKAAWWWLGVLYRKPALFERATSNLNRFQKACSAGKLTIVLSSTIVIFIYIIKTVCVILYVYLNFSFYVPISYIFNHLLNEDKNFMYDFVVLFIRGIFQSILESVIFSIIVAIFSDTVYGIIMGSALGTISIVGTIIPLGINVGVTAGIFIGTLASHKTDIQSGEPIDIAKFIGKVVLLGIFSGFLFYFFEIISDWIFFSTFFVLFCIGIATRLHYLLLTPFWLWPRPRGHRYPWHPVAWDDTCIIPSPGLDRLLLDYHRHAPAAADAEINRLIDSYPSQRPAALRAKTTLLIRASANAPLDALDHALATLPEGERGYLAQTARVKADAAAIAQVRREMASRDRPLFRALLGAQLVNRILAFQGKIAGFEEPLATELRAAAPHWLKQAETLVADADRDSAQAIRQLFRAGDPIDRDREAFVARWPVLEELERQVLLSGGCPGLLLYGRRRTGKSTILRGLEGLIPSSVLPICVSLQNPLASGDLANFCGHLRQKIAARLDWTDEMDDMADLPALMATLDRANAHLRSGGEQRLLIALDEYEMLDTRLKDGAFPVDLLATLRESIQTHRRIVWLLAGSHHIDELTHPDWASHLISVRLVAVPMFQPNETHQVLTLPLAHSTLFSGKDDPRQPHIAESFWGDGGVAWIQAMAGGWPYMVQLLAEAVVDEVNDRSAAAFDPAWRNELLDRAVGRGELALRQLLLGESRLPGETDYLLGFATAEDQAPPADPAVARSLHRRALVMVDDGDRWRLRAPLMHHWLVRNRHLL